MNEYEDAAMGMFHIWIGRTVQGPRLRSPPSPPSTVHTILRDRYTYSICNMSQDKKSQAIKL